MIKMLPALMLIGAILASGSAEAVQSEGKVLRTYDLVHVRQYDRSQPEQVRKIWDECHFVFSLQGIVNREKPRLYVFFVGDDDAQNGANIDRYWLDKLREPGEWLSDYRMEEMTDIESLVRAFRSDIKGLVVYDENVPATSNVASTVAGVHGFVPIRYDASPYSFYHRLVNDPDGPKLPVKVWLVRPDGSSLFTGKGTIPGLDTPSTGSAKCDAYIWAKEKLLDTGKCNPRKMGYYLDAYWLRNPAGEIQNHTLSNHDYFIANKGFIFDLSPWEKMPPDDDPDQPEGTDNKTLRAVLRSAYDQTGGKGMIHIGGFVPWDKKYTPKASDKHRDAEVESEWLYAEIISCFNAYMDADALSLGAMANASVYQHFPLKARYPQTLPTIDDLKARGYITADGKVAPKTYIYIYIGDYDSAAWLYRHMPRFWADPARGTVPLTWAFNPNLSDRFGPGMDYTRRTKSDLDFFVAGDNGAGYLNPQYLVEPRPHSQLPSGLDLWKQHCLEHYRRWDISLTGFVIEGNTPAMSDEVWDAYGSFSPDGIGAIKVGSRSGVRRGVPFVRLEADIGVFGSPEPASKRIINSIGGAKPEFFMFRTILWTPSDIKKLYELVLDSPKGVDTAVVDAYTLMLLIRQHESTK